MSTRIQILRGLEANRLSITPGNGEPLYCPDSRTLYMGDGVTPGGWSVTPCTVPKRQTVMYGSCDIQGLPNALTAGIGLSINLAANTIIAFAAGFGNQGAIDYVYVTPAITNIVVAPSVVNYIYAQRNNTTGQVTFGVTSVAPKYSSVAIGGQVYFNTMAMQMFDAAGNYIQRVYLGEAATTAVGVNTCITYSYGAMFDSRWFAAQIATLYTVNHNLGFDDYETYTQVNTTSGTTPLNSYVAGRLTPTLDYTYGILVYFDSPTSLRMLYNDSDQARMGYLSNLRIRVARRW